MDVIEPYLSDVRSFQNYVVGFSVAQSIAFLYALEKLLPKIYKFKKLIFLALAFVVLINCMILVLASNFEINIIKHEISDNAYTVDLVKKVQWFRMILIVLINVITIFVFAISSKKYQKDNT